MSRIAKAPVAVPQGVELELAGKEITVKASNGELRVAQSALVEVRQEDGLLHFAPVNESKQAHAMSGTMRQLVNNMIVGLTKGFEKKLTLVGVGYRAQAQGKKLNLNLGFSHPVDMELPDGVTVETPAPTEIVLKSADKQKLGQIASEIRSLRPPEPYKGKGVRYADERVIMKETKKK